MPEWHQNHIYFICVAFVFKQRGALVIVIDGVQSGTPILAIV